MKQEQLWTILRLNVQQGSFFFLTTQTTRTTRSRKTETDKQMTKMRTGKGSSVGFEPPDGGTTLFGKTAESRKETEKIRVFCFKL